MNKFHFKAHDSLRRSLVLALLFGAVVYVLSQMGAPGKIALAAGTITGTVFQDFNGDGTFNTTAATGVSKDLHVAGVTVTAYDSSGTARGSTTTVRCTGAGSPQSFCSGADSGPNYSLTATGIGPYRIEFTWDNASVTINSAPNPLLDFQPSARSTDSVNGGTTTNSGSTTQFVPDGNTSNVNLALNRTCDYCQNNPRLVTTRFENGLRTSSGTNSSIVSMAYTPASHTNDAQKQNTGAVWGVAYDGLKKRVYTSAFLKRHVDLGPREMDGVYVMDYSSGSGTLIGGFDLEGVTASNGGTINLGTVTRTGGSDYTLDAAGTGNVDLDAFGKVGKTGFGDIDFGADGKSLWMVNLYQRTLLKVDTSKVTVNTNNPNPITTAAVNHYNIVSGGPSSVTITDAPTCTSGNLRPFGLKIRGTKGYLGVVCDAVTSTTLQNPPELIGYILSFNVSNPTSFQQELSIPFNYNREPYYIMLDGRNERDAHWQRWMDTWSDTDINTNNIGTTGVVPGFRSSPSPLVSDIEFMPDGSLIIGVVDRFSHQSGWDNYKALSGDSTTSLAYGSAGDILYAKLNSNGTYTLESGENDQGDPFQVADRVGYRTDDSPGNAGEYFYGDAYTGGDATHGETILGALAYMPGADRVFSPAYDPTAFYTQGLIWQAVTPPASAPGVQIGAYAVSTGTNRQTFGKANGMGDMELLCDSAPIEIGNRVWRDDNGNGLQDPGEMAMAGLTVQLWADTNGDGTVDTQVGTATTDANGEYIFGGSSNTNMLSTSGGSTNFSTRISQSSDDAEQTVSSGSVSTIGGTIQVPRTTTATQLDGFRFQNITIPQGATITSATIQFTANNSDASTTVNATIRGQAADNAATFTTTMNDISSRGTTSASVAWSDIGSWTANTTTNATTPDLKSIVQEIVNRGGWSSGNSMAFVISDNSSSSNTRRRAYSYDTSTANAALLSITYTTATPYSIAPGTAYQVRIDPTSGSNTNLLTGLNITTQNAAQPANGNASATTNNAIKDVADNDAAKDANNNYYIINLTTGDTGANNHSLDFGFAPLGSIGNKVWLDENSDGYQDEGEDGIANVTVTLYDSSGNVVATKVTDSNGNYLFTGLAAGTYFVRVTSGVATGLTQTTIYPNAGVDLFNQDQSTGSGDYGYQVTLSAGQDNLTADFGYNWNPTAAVNSGTPNATAALGDRVWIDSNGNGRQDPGEVGVNGVTVTLYYAAQNDGVYDDVYGTTTTNQNGNYIFDNLPPGAYVAQVTGSGSASHNVLGGSYTQTGDPDHYGTTGTNNDNKTTAPIVLGPGDVFLDADFGYDDTGITLGQIGNFVWYDRDADGVGPSVDANGGATGGAETHGASGTADSEEGIGGVSIALVRDIDGSGTFTSGDYIIATQFTSDGTQDVDGDGFVDAKGAYNFRGLNIAQDTGNNRNDYVVMVTDVNRVLDGLRQTYDHSGSTSDGQSSVQNLSTTAITTEDFGYTPDNSGQQSSRTTLSLDANTGMIGNFVWFDVDGDGVGPNSNGNAGNDNTELGIPNVRVYLYDSTGTSLLATTFTGPDGYYLFPNLSAATYVVRVDTSTLPGGATAWSQTYDQDGTGSANQSTEALAASEVNLTHDFGFRGSGTLGSIGNLVWNDVNADGNVDGGENGIDGVTLDLYYDKNGNGKIDPGEPKIATTTTSGGGAYLFSGLPTDDGGGNAQYIVDVTDTAGVLAGYWHSLGAAGTNNNSQTDPYAVTLTPGSPNNLTADFGYYVKPAAIGNFVWKDDDADGIQDAGETGINGVVVKLTITYPGPNGVVGTGGDDTVTTLYTVTGDDPNTVAVETGWYSFANLLQDEDYNGANSAGLGEPTFVISVATADGTGALAGLAATASDQGSDDKLDSDYPAGVTATATEGSTTVTQSSPASSEGTLASYDFGYTFVDFGDAPDTGSGTGQGNYNTRFLDNGPFHLIVTGYRLGATIDPDSGTLQNGTATADDDNNTGSSDDEDGISMPANISANQQNVTINVTVTGAGGYLQAWIDWNRDGDFNDAGEQIATNVQDNGTGDSDNTGGNIRLIFNAPSNVTAGTSFARFRWSTTSNLGSTGLALNGEVEDYMVTLGTATALELSTVSAEPAPDGTIIVRWETGAELQLLGFNILRAGKRDGQFTAQNTELITALSPGDVTGNVYEFTDSSVKPDKAYFYRVEVVRTDNTTEQSEIVKAKAGADTTCQGKPDKASLLGPENDSKQNPGKLTFTWNDVNCAATYQVQIRFDSPKGELALESKPLKKAQFSTPKLEKGRTYVWRVQTCNADGKCSGSEWWTFKVAKKAQN